MEQLLDDDTPFPPGLVIEDEDETPETGKDSGADCE